PLFPYTTLFRAHQPAGRPLGAGADLPQEDALAGPPDRADRPSRDDDPGPGPAERHHRTGVQPAAGVPADDDRALRAHLLAVRRAGSQIQPAEVEMAGPRAAHG